MKIKYRTSDGEIIAMGEMPNLQPGAGEAVVDFNGEIPDKLVHNKFNGTSIEKKPQSEIDKIENENKPVTEGKFLQKYNQTQDSKKLDFLAKTIAKLSVFLKEKDIS